MAPYLQCCKHFAFHFIVVTAFHLKILWYAPATNYRTTKTNAAIASDLRGTESPDQRLDELHAVRADALVVRVELERDLGTSRSPLGC